MAYSCHHVWKKPLELVWVLAISAVSWQAEGLMLHEGSRFNRQTCPEWRFVMESMNLQ